MYVLITPAHNEAENVAGLVRCVRDSTARPTRWIVVDDASTDDTAQQFRDAGADLPIEVVPSGAAGGYMGHRYSEVLLAGSRALGDVEENCHVGILDCDIRFGTGYWAALEEALAGSPDLGIVSGVLCSSDDRGAYFTEPGQRIDLPRGGLRLVRGACFRQTGLVRSRAPDSVMTARAKMAGWITALLPDVLAWSVRPTDSKGDPFEAAESRGRRAFEVGQAPWVVLARASVIAARGRVALARGLVRGYLSERADGTLLEDPLVLRYYRRERLREWRESIKARVLFADDPHRYLPSRAVDPSELR